MTYTPPPDRPQVVVLTAGSDLYVLDADDAEGIRDKVASLIKAKIAVAQATIDAVEWVLVTRSLVEAEGVRVIDCRPNAVAPETEPET